MPKEISFLVFDLGGKLFAFELSNVREVVRVKEVTKVPRAPDYIKGVFNLRGQIVPLIDLSKVINAGSSKCREAIILSYDDELVGIAVESVRGVLRVTKDDITSPPSDASEFIEGLVKWGDRLVSILSSEKVLSRISGEEVSNY